MKAARFQKHEFVQGFRAMLPYWLGAAPFGIAYAIAAQKVGLGVVEIQSMSLTVYSAAAQMGMVQLLSTAATSLTIVLTLAAISIHHFLYGLSLSKHMQLSRLERLLVAYFMTDGAYGLTLASGKNENFSFLLGAELSMFVVWNLFTALGLLLSGWAIVPPSVHLDFVAPLTFVIVLVLTARSRLDWLVVGISVIITLLCQWLQLGSATVVLVGVSGAFIGALVANQHERHMIAGVSKS